MSPDALFGGAEHTSGDGSQSALRMLLSFVERGIRKMSIYYI